MKSFNDLKNFVSKKAKENQTFYSVRINGKSINMQIYSSTSYIEANMSVNGELPVIKFEEKTNGKISVAVSYCDDPGFIKYGHSKDFDIKDNLHKLLDIFPTGENIEVIVAALLSI